MPMEKKIIIVCEGKNDVSYLNALQRFIENDIPLPPGQFDRILAANAHTDTSAFESQIDALVYRLYSLSSEEIAVVEGCK